MTPADRARLYRRRKAGKVAPDATPAEIAHALRVHYPPGPAPMVPGIDRKKRREFKRKLGKTLTQLLEEKANADSIRE